MGTILRGAEEAAPPVAFSLPLQMEEDEADDGGSSSLALQILSQAAEESPRERFAIEPSATSAKRARDSSTGAGLGSAPQPGSPAKRQNSPRFGPTASPRLNGIASLRISPKITGVPALTSSSARLDPGAKKPRWVDVIAIAMEQLTEHTGRKSFKVAEVAEQIASPVLVGNQRPAIERCWLTENWRGALNSYFTNSKRFAPDPDKKKHWVLQGVAASPLVRPSIPSLHDDNFQLDGGSAAIQVLANGDIGSSGLLQMSLAGRPVPALSSNKKTQQPSQRAATGSARSSKVQQSSPGNWSSNNKGRSIPKPKKMDGNGCTGGTGSGKSKGRLVDVNRKPRWVDVIAVAMHQLMGATGRRSFKVAEVADQIARPPNPADSNAPPLPQPAIQFGMLTENWRGALNSYFTKSNKFAPDPERKSHWILQESEAPSEQVLQLLSEASVSVQRCGGGTVATNYHGGSTAANTGDLPQADVATVAAGEAEREILHKLMNSPLQSRDSDGRPIFANGVTMTMDLSTIGSRLDTGYYSALSAASRTVESSCAGRNGDHLHPGFVADVQLVWANAMQFSGTDRLFYQQAQQMAQYFEQLLSEHRQQLQLDHRVVQHRLLQQQSQQQGKQQLSFDSSARYSGSASGSGSESSSPMAFDGGSGNHTPEHQHQAKIALNGLHSSLGMMPAEQSKSAAATAAAVAAEARAVTATAASIGIANGIARMSMQSPLLSAQPSPSSPSPLVGAGNGTSVHVGTVTHELLESQLQQCAAERARLGAEHHGAQQQFDAAVAVLEQQRQQAAAAYSRRLSELEQAEAGLRSRQLALAAASSAVGR